VLQTSRQSIKACASCSDFKKHYKKKKEKKMRRNFEGTYLGIILVDSAKFGIGGAPP